MNEIKKIGIIGCGIGALSAAIRLAHKGYQVEIFEKNDQPGGRMHKIQSQGYQFDVGPTLVLMPQIYEELFTAVDRKMSDYLEMVSLDSLYKVHFHDKSVIDVNTDLAQLIPTLEGISTKDTTGYLRYLYVLYKRYKVAEKFILRGFKSPWEILKPSILFPSFKLGLFKTAYQQMKGFFKDERLQKLFCFQTLYIGISPHNGPSIYNIIPLMESLYGIHYVKGGMFTVAQALEKLFLELGGKIHYGCDVQTLSIEANSSHKVSGFEYNKDNQKNVFQSDLVISNADFPYALEHLIPKEYQKRRYNKRKQASFEYSCSAFILYLGIDKKLDLGAHTFLYAEDFDKNCIDIFSGQDPADPSLYLYHPSSLDETMAPAGKSSLYILVPVSNLLARKSDWTSTEIEQYRHRILSLIADKLTLDLQPHIETETIYTPNDFRDKFNAKHGAAFGLSPTLKQSNLFRPQARYPYLKNLYFTGCSTHPGAGIPIVLTSGKICAEAILQDCHQK